MRGQVPTARVGPIIAQLVEERWPARRRPDGEEWGTTILAEKVGCHPDAILAIIMQKNEGAEFNLVDQLLCSLGRPDYWRGQLADIYLGCNLSYEAGGYLPKGQLRCQRIGCGVVFTPSPLAAKSGPHKPRFCCTKCAWAGYKQQKNGIKTRPYGRDSHLRRMTCKKGHDLSGDNLQKRKDGKRVCNTCHREAVRDWRKKQRAKERVTG